MSDAFDSVENYGQGGGFFTPADHANAVAILFRPRELRKEASKYTDDNGRHKDLLVADYHIFRTKDDVTAGKPTEILLGAQTDKNGIIRKGAPMAERGKVAPVRLDKSQTTKGKAWVLVSPERDVCQKLAEYWAEVEAEEKAAEEEFNSLLGDEE